MNGRQLIRTGLLLASALLIVACRRLSPVDSEGTEATAPPSVSHGGPVVDYASLVDALRAAGATVEPAGSIEQDFFEPEGQIIRVNQQDVQVFEFESEEAAQAAAGTISPDGSSTGTTMITRGENMASTVSIEPRIKVSQNQTASRKYRERRRRRLKPMTPTTSKALDQKSTSGAL